MFPEGWEWEGVFGVAGRITPMPADAPEITALVAPQADPAAPTLPRGATPARFKILLGLVLLLLGFAALSGRLRMRAA